MNPAAERATGVLPSERLRRFPGCPTPERLCGGPVACIECVEDIPCNPCEAACPFGAIHVGRPITNLPVLDGDKCTGCGQCLPACPGLAIWVLDMTFSETEAAVTMPYEYLPLPRKGDVVAGLNRAGEEACRARVVKVRRAKKADGTAVVTVAVPRETAMEVRMIRVRPDAV